MACVCGHTAKTTCPPNDGTLLGQRRRRWSNNVQSLAECFACVVTYFLMAFIKKFPWCRALGDKSVDTDTFARVHSDARTVHPL